MSETPRSIRSEIQDLREDELILFIRDTVTRLNLLGDRLEEYAETRPQPKVGFEVPSELDDDDDGET